MSEMTDEQKEKINKFFHLLMDKHWHEWEKSELFFGLQCSVCGWHCNPPEVDNPDYFTPAGFHEVWKYIEGEWGEVWEGYLDLVEDDRPFSHLFNTRFFNKRHDLQNLFDYLTSKEVVEKWGYSECPNKEQHKIKYGDRFAIRTAGYMVNGEPVVHEWCNCIDGKIKHPALILLEGK